MCLYCHLNETQESAVRQLKKTLANPNFESHNTTSLNHILLAVSGLDGDEAHRLGVELIEQFYEWFLGRTNGYWEYFGSYFPKSGLEPFPSIKDVRKMIDDAKLFYIENGTKSRDEMIKIISGGKTKEEIKAEFD